MTRQQKQVVPAVAPVVDVVAVPVVAVVLCLVLVLVLAERHSVVGHVGPYVVAAAVVVADDVLAVVEGVVEDAFVGSLVAEAAPSVVAAWAWGVELSSVPIAHRVAGHTVDAAVEVAGASCFHCRAVVATVVVGVVVGAAVAVADVVD